MGGNGRAHQENYEPTERVGPTLPLISGSASGWKGDDVYAVRRRRSDPPRDKSGVEVWHASTPDPYDADYRWFWTFLNLVMRVGVLAFVLAVIFILLLAGA